MVTPALSLFILSVEFIAPNEKSLKIPEKVISDLKKHLDSSDVDVFSDFQLAVYQYLETELFPMFVKRSFYNTYSKSKKKRREN